MSAMGGNLPLADDFSFPHKSTFPEIKPRSLAHDGERLVGAEEDKAEASFFAWPKWLVAKKGYGVKTYQWLNFRHHDRTAPTGQRLALTTTVGCFIHKHVGHKLRLCRSLKLYAAHRCHGAGQF